MHAHHFQSSKDNAFVELDEAPTLQTLAAFRSPCRFRRGPGRDSDRSAFKKSASVISTTRSSSPLWLAALRGKLAPLVAILAFLAVLTGIALEVRSRRRAFETDERAVAMLTSSDAQALRLTAAAGVRPESHGVYRFRPGATTAVITLSNLTLLISLTAVSFGAANSPDLDAVVTSNTTFALDLYGKLRASEGNLFFSPHSIATALAMTYGGARGETEKQMAHRPSTSPCRRNEFTPRLQHWPRASTRSRRAARSNSAS